MVNLDSGWNTSRRWLVQRDPSRTGLRARPHMILATLVVALLVALVAVGLVAASRPELSAAPVAPHQAQQTRPPTTPARTTPTRDPQAHVRAVAQDEAYGSRPRSQRTFLATVAAGQDALYAARTDRRRQQALTRRNDELCRQLDRGRVSGWAGTLLSARQDASGRGVVEIEMAQNIRVATWNNPASDADDQTRLRRGRLLRTVLNLQRGDLLQFSGRLVPSDSCVNDSRLGLDRKLADPTFILKFSTIRRVG